MDRGDWAVFFSPPRHFANSAREGPIPASQGAGRLSLDFIRSRGRLGEIATGRFPHVFLI
jgi:hypothetical protein